MALFSSLPSLAEDSWHVAHSIFLPGWVGLTGFAVFMSIKKQISAGFKKHICIIVKWFKNPSLLSCFGRTNPQ
jgi:hypothetical protein